MNNATVTYNGVEMSVAEANSRQRAMERKIRAERSQLVALDNAIKEAREQNKADIADDLQISFDNLAAKMKGHEALYNNFCKETGLPVLSERLQYPSFNRSVSQKVVYATKRYEMSAQTGTKAEIYSTKPIFHNAEEIIDLCNYAKNSGIRIHQPGKFTGDDELLKEQIDVIRDLSKEYHYDKETVIMFKDMPSTDYGKTSK